MELNLNQKNFANFYIEAGNATESARKAGYKNPEVQGCRLLKNDKVLKYIADKQSKIEKTRGHDIMSLADIQARRSAIAKGEVEDCLGFTPDFSDQLKAMDSLEKTLTIQAKEEEKKRAAEEAKNAAAYHTDLDSIADTFHPVVRAMRTKKYREFVLTGGRGSTKSSCGTEIPFEIMMNNPQVHALALRQVANTLRDSIYLSLIHI